MVRRPSYAHGRLDYGTPLARMYFIPFTFLGNKVMLPWPAEDHFCGAICHLGRLSGIHSSRRSKLIFIKGLEVARMLCHNICALYTRYDG